MDVYLLEDILPQIYVDLDEYAKKTAAQSEFRQNQGL